ncbi:MAG: hypothetical protein KGI00_01185 [Candidatus Micrarchaeota archaeon]|nr:hypothetical protein [Candidatus Micrarchaeota archaeon]MDE1849322.1 hypothetical protein [Candidatus Micrarchaeota archaeon]
MASREMALSALAGRERMLDDVSRIARCAARACEHIRDTTRGMAHSSFAVFTSAPLFYLYSASKDAKFMAASVIVGGIGATGMMNSVYNAVIAAKEVRLVGKSAEKAGVALVVVKNALTSYDYGIANKQMKELDDQVKSLRMLGGKLTEFAVTSTLGTLAMGLSVYCAELYRMHPSFNEVTGAGYGFVFGTLALQTGYFGGLYLESRISQTMEGFKSIVRGREGINSTVSK